MDAALLTAAIPDPGELRAIVAKTGQRHYVLAARALISPPQFSRYLRGHDPVTPEIARRILQACTGEEGVP